MKWVLLFITLSAEGDPVTLSLGDFATRSLCDEAALIHAAAPNQLEWVGPGIHSVPQPLKIDRILVCDMRTIYDEDWE